MGVAYIFGAWKTATLLHDIDTPAFRNLTAGRYWLLFALMINWIGDTGAYYAWPQIRKTQTGAAGEPGKVVGRRARHPL